MGTHSQADTGSLPENFERTLTTIDISICIVTYQAREWLRGCLNSIYEHTSRASFEIIVIDNGSRDGVGEMLANEFPEVSFKANPKNLGYTRPMNQALRASRGRYLMQLNPDTIVKPGALDELVEFMENHGEAGICGPKVLNRDGTLQLQCRRGEPRPLAVLSYFLGLSKVFPNSRIFGGYLLNYLDEDVVQDVPGVSGSCMLIRREVIDQIGYLDESFFAYQEDTDYCLRARQAGWKIYYVPESVIIHYGGQGGTRVEPYRSIVAWHKSYWYLYKKHYAREYFFLLNWLYYAAMFAKMTWTLFANLFRREKFAGPRRS